MSSRPKQIANAMRAARGSLDKTTVGTVFAGVFAQLALVASGIVAARALGPEDRGRLALFQAIAVAGSFIISLGVPIAIAFWTAQDPRSARGLLRAGRRIFVLQAVFAIVVPAIVMATIFSGASHQVQLAAVISWPLTLAMTAMLYIASLFQGLHRFLAFNVFRTAPIAAYGFGVVLLQIFDQTLLADFMWVYSGIVIVTAIAGSYYALHRLPREVDRDAHASSRELLVYGLKGQIGNASPLENFQLDLLIVAALGGPIVLGFYVGGMAFTNLPRFVAQSIGAVAFPRTASNLKTGGATRKALEALLLTLVVSLVVIIPLEFLVGWLIPFLFGDAFAASIPVARILLISALFLSLRRVLGDVMRGGGVPLPSTAAEIVSWFVYGLCIWPLVDRHGATGAAIAMTAASGVSLLWLTIAAHRYLRNHRLRIEAAAVAPNANV